MFFKVHFPNGVKSMQVSPDGSSVRLTWQSCEAEFDTTVPGVDVKSIENMLVVGEDGLHMRWSRCPTRAAVLHVYDCLCACGIHDVQPTKTEALLGWDEMHPSTALVPISDGSIKEWGVPSMGDVLSLGDSFEDLLDQAHDVYVNHVWMMCEGLKFPVPEFEKAHLHIASELFHRCTNEVALRPNGDPTGFVQPHVFVRSYRCKGVIAPLLVWYQTGDGYPTMSCVCIHEHEVKCMLQEFLHVRYPHVPSATVWYWQLLPYYTNLETVGRHFDLAELLPSLRQLMRLVLGGREPNRMGSERVERLGQRLYNQLSTDHGNGRHTLWLGTDAFFYVEQQSDNALINVRLPATHKELPPWVLSLLMDMGHTKDPFALEKTVDHYLRQLEATGSRAVRLLRCINWAAVPLVWKPLFMHDAVSTVSNCEAQASQARLIKAAAPSWEEAEVVSESIDLLHRITGCVAD